VPTRIAGLILDQLLWWTSAIGPPCNAGACRAMTVAPRSASEMNDPQPSRDIPTVSICLPASRDPKLTARALRSALAQTFRDFEVLVGDETGDFAATAAAIGDERVDYRHNPQRLGYTRNHLALLDRARGRYLAVLHDDDWWEPTYVASMVAALEASATIGVATCDIRRDIAGTRRAAGPWPIPLQPGRNDDVLDLLVREEWFLLPTSSMWRREVFQGAARAWPLHLHVSELQMYLSAAEDGWAFSYVPEPLAHWVQHDSQSASHRGGDYGLAIANDTLEFWDTWLRDRSEHYARISRRQRANTQLRRGRALLLLGDRGAAREALAQARQLVGAGGPGYTKLTIGVRIPLPLVRAVLNGKRWAAGILGLRQA
jgi:glycosyltransferase involved in cell wall biosynthesis